MWINDYVSANGLVADQHSWESEHERSSLMDVPDNMTSIS